MIMKKLAPALLIIFTVAISPAWAERPAGYPDESRGVEVEIAKTDTNTYEIIANGHLYPVVRNAKIVSKDLKRIFLFQLKLPTNAVLIENEAGKVVEIWELPDTYFVEQY